MKAMILAAGLGTRLQHLTQDKPKALVEVEGKPLIAYVLEKLVVSGFAEVVINVHHFADQVIRYLLNNNFGAKIFISDETTTLLNTGGGIFNARNFLQGEEPFLVHNVDVFSNIDLEKIMRFHKENNLLATLAVGDRDSSRKFLFNEQMQLVGWKNLLTSKTIAVDSTEENNKEYAFTGIHVISPSFFSHIKANGAFSIVDAYLELCAKHRIIGYDTTQNLMLDVGKVQSLELASAFVKKKNL